MFGVVELWPHSRGLGNSVRCWRSVSSALTTLFLRGGARGSRSR